MISHHFVVRDLVLQKSLEKGKLVWLARFPGDHLSPHLVHTRTDKLWLVFDNRHRVNPEEETDLSHNLIRVAHFPPPVVGYFTN